MFPCPNLLQYRVINNVSDINNNVTATVLVPTTTLNIIGATMCPIYSIQLEASNAFGYGSATTIIAGKHYIIINNCKSGSGVHEV